MAIAERAVLQYRADHYMEPHAERRGAMVPMVVRPHLAAADRQRQARLRSIQSVDLTLFMEGEPNCKFGRMQMEFDNIPRLDSEHRIGRES